MKYTHRTYNSNRWTKLEEIHAHVAEASRLDADPIWHDIAKKAALNGCSYKGFYGGNYCGAEGVTFLRPTTCEKGYFNVLKWLSTQTTARWIEIRKHYNGIVPTTTLIRLRDGGLIENLGGRRGWRVTELGRVYLEGGERYLCNRKI